MNKTQGIFDQLSFGTPLIILFSFGIFFTLLSLAQAMMLFFLEQKAGYSARAAIQILENPQILIPEERLSYKLFLLLMQTLAFGGTSLIIALGFTQPTQVLGIHPPLVIQRELLAGTIALALLPFWQYCTLTAETFVLPESWHSIEQWAENAEEKSNLLLSGLLRYDLILNLFVFALIPAIMEELFFRGLLQHLFCQVLPVWISIVIISFIFSLFHFQVYGLIPRFLMGILLGFFRYHSRQLWPGIAAHFFNNAINIILAYYALNLPDTPDWINPEYRISEGYAAASLILGMLLIYFFNYKYTQTN